MSKLIGKKVGPTTNGTKINYSNFVGKIISAYINNKGEIVVSVKWDNVLCNNFGTSNLILGSDVVEIGGKQ